MVLLLAVLTTPGSIPRREPLENVLWFIVILTLVLSLIQGAGSFGLAAAGNEARGFFALAGATLWVWVRVPLPEFRREFRLWCWMTGLGLMTVALWHISQRGLGSVDELILVNGDLVTTRPLVATQALILGLIGLALLMISSRSPARVLALTFLTMAILCQHRSVWASLAVAAVSLVLFASKVRMRLLLLGVVSSVVILTLYAAGTLDPLVARFDAAYHSRGTLVDRQLAWSTLVDQQNKLGGASVLLGQPFGTGFARREPSGTIEYFAPHNYYVSVYLRIGLLGLAALVIALLRGVWRNLKFRQPVGLAWGAGLMTYCYAYNLQLFVAPVLALCLGAQFAPSSLEDEEGDDASAMPSSPELEASAALPFSPR
jgi:hypothetical protein